MHPVVMTREFVGNFECLLPGVVVAVVDKLSGGVVVDGFFSKIAVFIIPVVGA